MQTKGDKISKAYSYADIERMNFKTLPFEGIWYDHIGTPQLGGSWIVWGGSGNGKTSYLLQLTKYICQFEKVHIDTLEEGLRLSFKNALIRENMKSVENRFNFHNEDYEALTKRLNRKRMPKVVIIDSLQYFFRKKNLSHYWALLDAFPTTTFIFNSHAKGGEPKGDLADAIRYHSDVKIHVKDFCANVQTSRFGGNNEPYIIWQKEYERRQLKLVNKG